MLNLATKPSQGISRCRGVSFPELQRLVAEGAVEKVGPGLYRLAAAKPDELETIARAPPESASDR
jgi:hypothetical protein